MAIDFSAFGEIGVVLFFIILFIMECFFGVIGLFIANFAHLTGVLWWIVVLGIVIIFNAIFVNIN